MCWIQCGRDLYAFVQLDLIIAKDSKSTKVLKQQFGSAMKSIWSDDEDEDQNDVINPDAKKVTTARPESEIWDTDEMIKKRESDFHKLRLANEYNEADLKIFTLTRQQSITIEQVQESYKRCTICHREFKSREIKEHEDLCALEKKRCPKPECGLLYNRKNANDEKLHEEQMHVRAECECGATVLEGGKPMHYKLVCPSRKKCPYCRIKFLYLNLQKDNKGRTSIPNRSGLAINNFSSCCGKRCDIYEKCNYITHEKMCGDIPATCPDCKKSIKIRDIFNGSHLKDESPKTRCEVKCKLNCGQTVRTINQGHHESAECNMRQVPCKICNLQFPFKALSVHQSSCEARHNEALEKLDGKWSCTACTFRNDRNDTKCSTCNSARSGAKVAEPKSNYLSVVLIDVF